MSACWGSRRRVTRAAVLAGWLAGLALGLPAAGLARSAGSSSDTGRVVHVHVGDGSIVVKRAGSSEETVIRGTGGHGDRVDIGPGGIRIDGNLPDSIDVNVPRVRVHGHNVTVDGEPAGLVRVFADVHVPAGTTVDGDAVAVFGSVTVEGHVTGGAVAVLGSVHLAPGASVEGDAVAVGGGLDQAPGSTVHGETVSIGFLPLTFGPPRLGVVALSIVVCWLLTLFMAWLLDLLFRERLVRTGMTASRQSGASIFVGLLSAPFFVIGMLLLTVTVIGIPIAILLPFAYALTVWAGQLAATYLLGCKLLQRRAGEAPALVPMVVGSAFVAAFFAAGALLSGPPGFVRTLALFFTLIGVLLVTGLSILGTGALLVSRFGSRPRESGLGAGALAAPAAPPTPAS